MKIFFNYISSSLTT